MFGKLFILFVFLYIIFRVVGYCCRIVIWVLTLWTNCWNTCWQWLLHTRHSVFGSPQKFIPNSQSVCYRSVSCLWLFLRYYCRIFKLVPLNVCFFCFKENHVYVFFVYAVFHFIIQHFLEYIQYIHNDLLYSYLQRVVFKGTCQPTPEQSLVCVFILG